MATLTQEEQRVKDEMERQAKQNRIYSLMADLTSSASEIGDWKIAKMQEYVAAGIATPYEISVLYKKRQAVRDEINKLRAELGLTETDESLTAEQLEINEAKAQRADIVSKSTVTVDGMTFDADEISQNRMARVVSGAQALGVDLEKTTQIWVLADNTIAQPTIAQLAKALRLAGEAMTNAWTVPYSAD